MRLYMRLLHKFCSPLFKWICNRLGIYIAKDKYEIAFPNIRRPIQSSSFAEDFVNCQPMKAPISEQLFTFQWLNKEEHEELIKRREADGNIGYDIAYGWFVFRNRERCKITEEELKRINWKTWKLE